MKYYKQIIIMAQTHIDYIRGMRNTPFWSDKVVWWSMIVHPMIRYVLLLSERILLNAVTYSFGMSSPTTGASKLNHVIRYETWPWISYWPFWLLLLLLLLLLPTSPPSCIEDSECIANTWPIRWAVWQGWIMKNGLPVIGCI